jgi:murein DD-endopeptidase MepM/ murein hydrolase activator NlpD
MHPHLDSFKRRIRHAFRERQIYLRSEGQVQFVTLRPWVQAVFASIVVAGLFWLSFATVNITFKDQIIAAKERRALQMQIAYEDRLAALQTVVDRINDRLMLDQNAYMDKVGELRELHRELVDRHQLLTEVLKRGWGPKLADDRPDDVSEAVPEVERGSTTAVVIDGPDDDPAESAPRHKPKRDSRAGWEEPAREFRTREEAAQPIVNLRTDIATLRDEQESLLDQVESNKKSQVDRIEGALSKLGLAPSRIAARKTASIPTGNVGGPFVSLRSVWPEDKATRDRILRIERHISRIERLRRAVKSMPVGRPLGKAHGITSGYGVRRDPLRKVLAAHYGIDFRGNSGDEVSAAADGTVVQAESQSGYGNLVELRHDNGVSTRYAHLSRIDVKVGQKVARHDPIGRIGNTGRSTGPHLHYEILVSGKPVDPRRFWRVGENVLKAQKQ